MYTGSRSPSLTDVRAGTPAPSLAVVRAGSPEPSFAVCITGLERSFPEIRHNIQGAVLRPVGYSPPVLFGVRPAADRWPTVLRAWNLADVEVQRMCVADAAIPNASSFYPFDYKSPPGSTVRLFVQELCDLAR